MCGRIQFRASETMGNCPKACNVLIALSSLSCEVEQCEFLQFRAAGIPMRFHLKYSGESTRECSELRIKDMSQKESLTLSKKSSSVSQQNRTEIIGTSREVGTDRSEWEPRPEETLGSWVLL